MKLTLISSALLLAAGLAFAQCSPTPAQTEGPYYTPGAPAKTSLIEEGSKGTKLVLQGQVLDAACKPIAGAVLDFWQADEKGQYDNRGYRYRGKVTADPEGKYRLETVVPGEYPGRTQHIHVKVWVGGRAVLTSQIYFPGSPRNQSDSIFNPSLLAKVQTQGNSVLASFNFVVR